MKKKTEEQESLEWLKSPRKWPYIACPVKNRKPDDDGFPILCGLVFEDSPIVVKLSIWRSWTPEEFRNARRWKYASLEAMVLDGWVVD